MRTKSCIILALGVAVAALSVAPSRAGADEASAPKAEKKAAPKSLHATGSVDKVDGANLVIKLHNSETSTFVTDTDVKVMKGNTAASMGDVKVGQRVRVMYDNANGKMSAKEIHILPARAGAAHHKSGEAKEKK